MSHHQVRFEVLHHQSPGVAIGQFAENIDAVLIVASTHGGIGLARLALGSVRDSNRAPRAVSGRPERPPVPPRKPVNASSTCASPGVSPMSVRQFNRTYPYDGS